MKNHPVTWQVWVLGAAVCALLTRNPLYLAILGLSAWLTLLGAGQQTGQLRGWLGLVHLGALIWVITIPFNALMMHEGNIVLLRLPNNWPLVGGKITLEAVAYGASSGLAVWTLILLFAAFNTVIDASELIRLTPSVFYQASIITSIGLTFIPQMISSAQEIREAQRVRGHRFRSWRDLIPLVMPLLTTSLERAMMLAESMEARGFGGETTGLDSRRRLQLSLLILLGLALLFVGLIVGLWWRQGAWWVAALVILGILCLGYAFISLAQHNKRSHYKRQRWQLTDTCIGSASFVATAIIVLTRLTNNLSLTYYPFPPGSMLPSFNPWLGIALALFSIPGLISIANSGPMSPISAIPPEVAP
ncbi:MAG: energy-coupling factor transporter transmembrane component T [Anaerolineae bacterium]